MIEQTIISAIIGGINALIDYLSAHVLTCLMPAFFIAGAMNALLPKESITKHLGEKSPPYKAYPLAVVSGLLLAVCSCTILPLFAGIKKKGAGLGPAVAFLYTAPATNLLAIAFTGSVIGWDFAGARIVLSVIFAVAIGMILSSVFRNNNNPAPASVAHDGDGPTETSPIDITKVIGFIATLVVILFVGTWKLFTENTLWGLELRWVLLPVLVLIVIGEALAWFTKEQRVEWLGETGMFMKTIFPLLFIGIFVAGAIGAIMPENFLASYLGENSIFANLVAVLFGTVMYFPTLIEVPMAKMFLGLGMSKGPLLAYMLADPVISLPSILVVRKYMGTGQTLLYVGLIIFFCTLAGWLAGTFLW